MSEPDLRPTPGTESTYRIDRSAFAVVGLMDADDAPSYWRAKSPQERLVALDYLRRMAYGPAATARLQRVFEVAQLG